MWAFLAKYVDLILEKNIWLYKKLSRTRVI